jgi:hypothetical protein
LHGLSGEEKKERAFIMCHHGSRVSKCLIVVTFVAVAGVTRPAAALTVPFTEDFAVGTANWFTDSGGTTPPFFALTGGPDGGSFVGHSFNFVNSAPSDTPLFFRGQATFGSSNGAFVGDWIAGGVSELSASVRHSGDASLIFFARVAPAGGPGVVALSAPVPGGTWTQLSFPILSSGFINEGPPGMAFFNNVMSNVGNVQFGALPGSLAGVDHAVDFDLDKVAIVPEPAALALLLFGSAACALRRGTGSR